MLSKHRVVPWSLLLVLIFALTAYTASIALADDASSDENSETEIVVVEAEVTSEESEQQISAEDPQEQEVSTSNENEVSIIENESEIEKTSADESTKSEASEEDANTETDKAITEASAEKNIETNNKSDEISAPEDESASNTTDVPKTRMLGAPQTPPPAPSGTIVSHSGKLAYKIKEDSQNIVVYGLLNNRWVNTTYNNYGFEPVLRLQDGFHYIGASSIKNSTNIVIKATPTFSESGNAIYLAYTIDNKDSNTVNFDFAIYGDIEIDGDDGADVTFRDDNRGFVMKSTYQDEEGDYPALAIFYGNTAGVNNATNVWVGSYYDHESNYFSNKKEDVTGIDSAFSVSWLGQSLAPNEQMSLGVGNAAGSMEEASEALEEDPLADYTISPNGKLAYKVQSGTERIIVMRNFNNKWIQTTFGIPGEPNFLPGFYPVVRVADGNGIENADAIEDAFGLIVRAKPTFTADGDGVYLRYTITNPVGASPITFDFAIGGDIQIASDDTANVVFLPGDYVFKSTSSKLSDRNANGEYPSIAIYYANMPDVTPAENVWVGDYADSGQSYFVNLRNSLFDTDSAFATSWLGITLGSGESVTKAIVCAVKGEAEGPAEVTKTESKGESKAILAKAAPVERGDALPATSDATNIALALGLFGLTFAFAGTAIYLRKERI